ncbi:MAG: hypothetical protein ACREBU_02510 [Nitrososphaera sp.]
MTSHGRLKVAIFGAAILTAIAMVVIGSFYYAPRVETFEAPAWLPYESTRTGIPIIEAVEMINAPETLYYNPIKDGEHEYLWRAVDKGATFLSDSEMKTYFTSFNEKGYRFSMQTADGTKFYRIYFFEPPISVDTHWIKMFVFDEQREDAKLLSDLHKIPLAPVLNDPYRWVSVDEETALLTKALIETEGQYFTGVITMGETEGVASFRLMYLGPLSEELKQPEFQAMYDVEAGAGH